MVSGFRPTRAGQLHLTLVFIGGTRTRDLGHVTESFERAAAGVSAFSLIPQRVRTWPPGPYPRTLVALTDAPSALMELQKRLAQRLLRAHERRAGPFVPHVTLGRFAPDARAAEVDEPVEGEAFGVREIALMASRLTPAGAEHEVVARAGLIQ